MELRRNRDTVGCRRRRFRRVAGRSRQCRLVVGDCFDFEVSELVNAWLEGARENYGFLVKAESYVSSCYTQFGSREMIGLEPLLIIEPPAVIFADGFETGDTGQWSAVHQ